MLLSNPLASPYLQPLGMTLVGLLGSSFLALLLALRSRLGASSLFVRWRSWLLIAPAFTLVVLSGPLPLALFAATLAVQGSTEYASLAGLTRADRSVLIGASGLLPPASLLLEAHPAVLLALPLAATLPPLLSQDAEHGLARLTRLAFGLCYLPLALSLLVMLDQQVGPGLLLSVALAVALSDVGAFALGRLLGRRRFAPGLSPSKTWAGVVGNLAGAALGLLLLQDLLPTGIHPLLLAVVVGGGAVWGDLLESLLKRSAGVKDTGAWLPGFGGLLDRLDSLLVVVPLIYLLVLA